LRACFFKPVSALRDAFCLCFDKRSIIWTGESFERSVTRSKSFSFSCSRFCLSCSNIDSYAESASIAKRIGADAVEIHSAHQSFLSQFLSPITNTRTDRWGGCIENRMRIHQEIFAAIRAKVGNSFPVFIKIGVEDALPDGLKFVDGLEIASRLAANGYDALEISMGLQDFSKLYATGDWSGTSMQRKNNCYRNWTREIKKQVSVPVIMTGGIRSFESIEEMMNNHEADLFGLCRPLIREPNLISRWKKNDHRPAKCVSCNQCISEIYMKGNPLECFLGRKYESKCSIS